MPTYETLFITLPTLTEDEEKATVSAMVQAVTDGGGQVVAAERMGRRRLAYSIRKFDEGIYQRLLFDAPRELPRELERRVRISDRILRHLTVRLEEDWAEAAKKQAVRDAEARAEAARAAAEAAREAEEAGQRAEPTAPAEEGAGET